MPSSERSTQGELEYRYAIIRKLIAKGYTGGKVWKYVRDKTDWNISRRQAYNYYDAVYEQFAEDATGIDRAAYFVRTLDRLDFIYQKSVSDNDLTVARQVTMDVVKLLKLDMPDVDFDWTKTAAEHGFSQKEVKARLSRLMLEDEQGGESNGDRHTEISEILE